MYRKEKKFELTLNHLKAALFVVIWIIIVGVLEYTDMSNQLLHIGGCEVSHVEL